jgi:phosphoribosyl-dephospho-CoA transferase
MIKNIFSKVGASQLLLLGLLRVPATQREIRQKIYIKCLSKPTVVFKVGACGKIKKQREIR